MSIPLYWKYLPKGSNWAEKLSQWIEQDGQNLAVHDSGKKNVDLPASINKSFKDLSTVRHFKANVKVPKKEKKFFIFCSFHIFFLYPTVLSHLEISSSVHKEIKYKLGINSNQTEPGRLLRG